MVSNSDWELGVGRGTQSGHAVGIRLHKMQTVRSTPQMWPVWLRIAPALSRSAKVTEVEKARTGI